MPLDRTRHIKKQAAVMKHRRELWVIENGPCQLCGSWESLEVDHRDPEDKFSHRIWSYTEEKRAEELAKCRVLCRSCHISRHAQEKVVHGTRSRFEAGCRCEPCSVANDAYKKEKARKKREDYRENRAHLASMQAEMRERWASR
jgi:5-methylcytosine-specific restriction endonuclease McrA